MNITEKWAQAGQYESQWERTLPQVLLSKVDSGAEYMGTHVYASINPKSEPDRRLRIASPPSRSGAPTKGCRKEITRCPHCSKELVRTVEKGVDTSIAIELFHFALDNVYDRAILISNDEDFVPATNTSKGAEIISSMLVSKTKGSR